jgi:hypothetical protein
MAIYQGGPKYMSYFSPSKVESTNFVDISGCLRFSDFIFHSSYDSRSTLRHEVASYLCLVHFHGHKCFFLNVPMSNVRERIGLLVCSRWQGCVDLKVVPRMMTGCSAFCQPIEIFVWTSLCLPIVIHFFIVFIAHSKLAWLMSQSCHNPEIILAKVAWSLFWASDKWLSNEE